MPAITSKNQLKVRFPTKSNSRVLKGKWKLDANHDLVFELEDKTKLGKHSLLFKGKIINTQKDSLAFQIKTKTIAGKERLSILKLRGKWQVDKYNRITFEVKKNNSPDILTFKGNWKLNRQQKIVYTYQKTNLKTKTKTTEKLLFDGFWQINEKNRLRYILAGSKSSFFDFKAYIQSNNLYPKKGAIKYRIGIGVKEERQKKIISLYGSWKFSRKLGLTFEMDYGKGQISRIQFTSTVNLNKRNKITFALRDKNNKPLGINVIFKHKAFISKDLEYFLKLKKQGKILYLGIGSVLRF